MALNWTTGYWKHVPPVQTWVHTADGVLGVFDLLTWGGQLVLPGGFVVIQRQQHDVHGESKHPRQEQVEDQVEEQDQTLGGETEQKLCYYIVHDLPSSPSSPPNVIFIILLCSAPSPAADLHSV